MNRAYYSDLIANFLTASPDEILGTLTRNSAFAIDKTQRDAWLEEIEILKHSVQNRDGRVYFEYSIPRMGKRIDVVLLIGPVIFVLEFKVGEKSFSSSGLDQVCDYCLDLKNFHEPSNNCFLAPILIATASRKMTPVSCALQNDKLLCPIPSSVTSLRDVIDKVLLFATADVDIDAEEWERGRYCPTPTIIEAALALYKGHSVEEITRHEAGKPDISATSNCIDEIIRASKKGSFKSICFVTGVPGAGKTLVGLDVATKHQRTDDQLHSVFLSGNGPLVAVLREALACDHVQNEKEKGRKIKKHEARSKVQAFIQNVHHFRDDCLQDPSRAPVEHVALFDEAQRAWDQKQTSKFMRGGRRKKSVSNFNKSEPEFLLSCLDRHDDWAVVVCLVGGGQEIHTGEAGISEWVRALENSFPDWHVYISSQLTDSEYGAGRILERISSRTNVSLRETLHLAVSMRSFRAENVSRLVKELLDLETKNAQTTLAELSSHFPVVITRDLTRAKEWLRDKALGSERYGIVVSSQAERLKPHAIDVKRKVNPVHWFLYDKHDVRSSFYLEDVTTEFHVQGLELDWVCVTWDADFRYSRNGWEHRSFRGKRWNMIKKSERRTYQKNAYRVLLTRARQGMVIVVPPGDDEDATRKPEFYDPTFNYLKEIGFTTI